MEQRYAQIEREALAIYNGLTKCHNYIYGKRITVTTDHKHLLGVFNKQATSIRLQRIVDRCADYDFELILHPGPVNIADALSRLHKSTSSNDLEIETDIKVSLARLCCANTFTTIQTATLADEELQFLTAANSDEWKKPNYKRNLKTWCRFKDELTIFEDVIIKNGAIIIPESRRQDILAKAHSTHQGNVRTKQYLRNAVYWPETSSEFEEICKDCRICRQHLPQEDVPLSPVEWPERPWIQFGIDLYSFEFDQYLTKQDNCSKWPEVNKMKKTTTRAVIACLKDCFSRFGNPQKLDSDNGPQFSSFAFREFLKKVNVEHVHCAPLHAQSSC